MDINEQFPSKYLKAADLQGREITLTIDDIRCEDVGDDADKPVVYFSGKKKGLILNKTNANNISMMYGPETDVWKGKPVVLFTTWVDFQGKSVEGIRVRPQAPQPAPAPETGPAGEPLDDEIPF